ncbi:circadian clock-controlled protein-like [Agrilus planipennis]|uniref:Circadian clock-controlled protein-like n=1 Tax=Agrilus planipennis TaxID=224129 RepID=A0A1W4WAQ0_AGRPL|nr:circadian clock-controlled protein-like [Agrilus planipennis]
MEFKCGFVLFFGLMLISFETSTSSAKLPSYFRICRHDPNIAGCIENFLITLKPKLKEGIPELHVPPMEPLDLGEINLQTTDNHGMLNFTNLKVWGCSDYTIKNVMVDLSRHIFKYNLKLPRLYFEGNYDMDMRLLAFELKDSGFMKGNLSNYRGNCLLHGKKINRNGNDYLTFNKIQISIELGTSEVQLDSSLKRNLLISKAIDELVVNNVDKVIEDMKPAIERALAEKFLRIANVISRNLPYNELFPSS